jgi:histidine triad (HIT) family protein
MCVFCKIINNELPAYKVYEDDNVLAFLDIKPVNPGHILVIPKKHYQNLEEITDDDLVAVSIVVKKVGKLLMDKLEVKGYNVISNNDSIAGQIVPHLHFHIIPRISSDGLPLWPGNSYQDGEAEQILDKLKK